MGAARCLECFFFSLVADSWFQLFFQTRAVAQFEHMQQSAAPFLPPPHIVLIHRSVSEWELCGPTASPHLSVQTLSVLARGIKRSAEPRLCHGNL